MINNGEERFVIDGIGQIAINVHDIARAVEFYRDALGLKPLFELSNMAFFDCGGVRIMLGIASAQEFDHPSSIIYFRVKEIQGAVGVLTSRGVLFEGKPTLVAIRDQVEIWMAFFRDVDRNLLALMSEVPQA